MNDYPSIAQLGHVTISTPDIEKSLWFFRDILGMEEVARDGKRAYLRAYQEHEHHSLILEDSNVAELQHVAFRTNRPEDVEGYARQFKDAGVDFIEVPKGTKTGQGDAIRFFMPHGGHPIEIFYDIDKPKAPEAIQSKLLSNSSTRRGLGVRRIDHVNLHTSGPELAKAEAWVIDNLGFKRREAMQVPDGPLFASWTSVTPQVHDMALVSNVQGKVGAFHHVAFNVESYSDALTAADQLRDLGIQIDLGPGKHGVGQAMFLYVRDPGSGHRVEIYAGGYFIFAPDWEPKVWTPESFGEALVWYGEPLPMNADANFSQTTNSTTKLV
ncbi:VOC family protein [soil metagenome]